MKHLFWIGLTSMLFACNNTTEDASLEGKLSTDLVNNPRTADNLTPTDLANLGKLLFNDTLHDFGKIKEGEVVEYEFSYTNIGKKDLIINSAKGSCGCTVPAYPETPIKAGEKATMKVTFNSRGKKGYNEKTVTVSTNGNPAEYILKIQATVE